MSTSNAIAPLKKVQFMQTSNPTVCGMQLLDFNDRDFIAGLDAGGLAFMVAALLEQGSHPDFAAAWAEGNPRPALASVAGNAIALEPGRSADEVAVSLTIGSVEVAVHLPRTAVLAAFAAMGAE
jgi:hypothetical protein